MVDLDWLSMFLSFISWNFFFKMIPMIAFLCVVTDIGMVFKLRMILLFWQPQRIFFFFFTTVIYQKYIIDKSLRHHYSSAKARTVVLSYTE